MPEIHELDAEDLRALVRQRLQARTHWMVLLSDQERHLTHAILAAIDAYPQVGTARVRVDLWGIDLHTVDAEDGTIDDLGAVLFISWPRPAMPLEAVHATLSQLFGHAIPMTELRERPIIVPVATSRLWQTGAQLNALQDWLFEEDDG
jgi:hypothetical protein